MLFLLFGQAWLKFSRGQNPLPPTNSFCLYPPPVLRCFWKDPLMTSRPHPTSSTFHCYPPPYLSPLPPKKKVDHITCPVCPKGGNERASLGRETILTCPLPRKWHEKIVCFFSNKVHSSWSSFSSLALHKYNFKRKIMKQLGSRISTDWVCLPSVCQRQ